MVPYGGRVRISYCPEGGDMMRVNRIKNENY